MTNSINYTEMTKAQLLSEAKSMSKYIDDVDGAEILNEILMELKWHMSYVAFDEFKKSISVC